MGCVSSAFLQDEDSIVGGAPLGHHIVSLTSTTYGLLTTLDQPTTPAPSPHSSTRRFLPTTRSGPEFINSWELMAGLVSTTPTKPALPPSPIPSPSSPGKENGHRPLRFSDPQRTCNVLRPVNAGQRPVRYSLEMFEKRCPPGAAQAAVLYTTTLRVVRKTFEDCNAVRAAVEGLGVWVRERDVSMDLGFREELQELMKGRGLQGPAVPRLFVSGRDIGGKEAVLRIHEEGELAGLLEGLPRKPRGGGGGVCDGCGGVRFIPCFRCSGSRKMVAAAVPAAEEKEAGKGREGKSGKGKVVRCTECNENGLLLCPICG